MPDSVASLDAGLCTGCRHHRILRSKTSRFVRCGLSDQDPSWPRYPRLPVLHCRGYEADGST